MSLWEYKVITSGKGGFATPVLLEKFLNDLGRDEWEIVHFQSQTDNVLAFTGLARRSTQRDWSLQDAAAAAAKAEAEKLRAEFAAKFQAATSAPAEEKPSSLIEEKAGPDDGFRKPIDTSRDSESGSSDDEEKDDWDKLNEENELPAFFDALKPHMRRNQRGPGMSVGVDFLAKKWDLGEDDVKGALVECGMQIPADEDEKPVYVEYDGDLFWVNINRRGELWINTREKPRPVFRVVQGTRVEGPEPEARKPEYQAPANAPEPAEVAKDVAPSTPPPARTQAPSVSGAPLPAGVALLDRVRPQMRRNRRGPGGSGSATFLSRALKCSEADLSAAFTALGLVVPEKPDDKPVYVELGGEVWWLNKDSRGGLWINGREKEAGETSGAPAASNVATESSGTDTAAAAPAPTPRAASPAQEPGAAFSAVRLLLKETKTGSVAGKAERLAGELGKSTEEFIATLVGAGLKVPEKAREKPVFVEHGGEIFWLNKNAKDEVWLNAKASKYSDSGDGDKKAARKPKKKAEAEG